jgi:hypothetical protein
MVDWKVINATGDTMEILLNFTKPVWVAAGDEPCIVDVYFGTGKYFKNSAFGEPMERDFHFRKVLPSILPQDPLTDILAQATEGAKYGVLAVAGLGPTFGISKLFCMVEGL